MRKSVIPSRMEYGVYRSPHIFCLTGVQERFLATLEMTIRGRRYSHFPPARDAFSHSLSYRECPIRPFEAPSPRGEGFWCGAAVFSFRRLLHGEKDLGLLPPSSGRRCPEGAEVGSRSGMRRKVRQHILPFRHPERSRWIFPFAAVYDMHSAAQKIARALISHSPFHRCPRKISRLRSK